MSLLSCLWETLRLRIKSCVCVRLALTDKSIPCTIVLVRLFYFWMHECIKPWFKKKQKQGLTARNVAALSKNHMTKVGNVFSNNVSMDLEQDKVHFFTCRSHHHAGKSIAWDLLLHELWLKGPPTTAKEKGKWKSKNYIFSVWACFLQRGLSFLEKKVWPSRVVQHTWKKTKRQIHRKSYRGEVVKLNIGIIYFHWKKGKGTVYLTTHLLLIMFFHYSHIINKEKKLLTKWYWTMLVYNIL